VFHCVIGMSGVDSVLGCVWMSSVLNCVIGMSGVNGVFL
jgi:hypothetical protein